MLRITASPRFSLWINGRYVGLGPARCYPSQQLYDEWDITPYVQEGHNAFAVLVRKPSGVAGYSLLNRVGLYMEGDIWGCDGSYTPVITDASWKVREADWYVPTPYVISLPLGGGRNTWTDSGSPLFGKPQSPGTNGHRLSAWEEPVRRRGNR